MKIGITTVLCGLLLASAAGATETSGTITRTRTYSDNHPYPTAQGVTIVRLSQALQGGCSWVYIPAGDKASLAVVLAAKATQAPATIWYEPTVTSPWGDVTICAVTTIELT